ncbi:MAG TPA: tagaturonate epimerase family protein, partial [Bacteroidales bacterium]|nr:tagaturonate epimerase family protein [Bacteroidales bacterium]
LFFILKMMADNRVWCQTIAPKFSGRFNKGVDYVGDVIRFAEEFEEDLLVVDYAIKEFGLPGNLKLSVHSGSDKFTIYPYISSLIKKHDKGIHLKTAGTTWLEEVIGLAEAGGKALDFVKEIYAGALEKREELCAPYADVIDIDPSRLPSADEVSGWNKTRLAEALRHIPGNALFNPDMRQLIHVGYKMAAERMDEYYMLLNECRDVVGYCVFDNVYNRHIRRLFDI